MEESKITMLKKILNELVPYWEPAQGFLLLLDEEWNDELKENVYREILIQIKNVKSTNQQEQIKTALEKLKEKSESSIKADEEDAEKMLDEFINNIDA